LLLLRPAAEEKVEQAFRGCGLGQAHGKDGYGGGRDNDHTAMHGLETQFCTQRELQQFNAGPTPSTSCQTTRLARTLSGDGKREVSARGDGANKR
jgi:hypothetical protein